MIVSTPASSDGGYATPARGTSLNRIGLAWSVTKNPFTSSAGCVAHHPTTPTERPSADATFQTAGTARDSPEIGTFWPVFGSTCWKSRMRCTSGPTPVATVVQTTGESTGMKLFNLALYPSDVSRFQLGIRPSAARRSSSSQSRPSSPSQITGVCPPASRRLRASTSEVSTGAAAGAAAAAAEGGGEVRSLGERPQANASRAIAAAPPTARGRNRISGGRSGSLPPPPRADRRWRSRRDPSPTSGTRRRRRTRVSRSGRGASQARCRR